MMKICSSSTGKVRWDKQTGKQKSEMPMKLDMFPIERQICLKWTAFVIEDLAL